MSFKPSVFLVSLSILFSLGVLAESRPSAQAIHSAQALSANPAALGPSGRTQPPDWAGAFETFSAADAESMLLAPYFTKTATRSSRIHVMNIGSGPSDTTPANVTVTFSDSSGVVLSGCVGCTASMAPRSSIVFEIAALSHIAVGTVGSAVIESDSDPLIAVVETIGGGEDIGLYRAASESITAATVAYDPRVLVNDTGGTTRAGSSRMVAMSALTSNLDAEFRAPPKSPVSIGAVALARGVVSPLNISGLSNGAWSAELSSDETFATLNETSWGAPGGITHDRESIGTSNPWLPLVYKNNFGRCSVVSVYNSAAIIANVTVHVVSAVGALVDTSVSIGANDRVDLDLCNDPTFSGLPTGFVGGMRLRGPDTTAIAASTVVEAAGKMAMAGYAGLPVSVLADTLYAPLVHSDWQEGTARLDTTIGVVNPSSTALMVEVAYVGIAGSCAGMTFVEGPRNIPGNRAVRFDQSPSGGGVLPTGCRATAIITSDGVDSGILAAVIDEAYLLGGPTNTPTPTATPTKTPHMGFTPIPGVISANLRADPLNNSGVPCAVSRNASGIGQISDPCDTCCVEQKSKYGIPDVMSVWGSGAAVNPATGELIVSEVDLEIPSRGFNWRFERRFRSGITYDGPLGRSWDTDLGRRLVEVTAPLVGVDIGVGGDPLALGDILRMDGSARSDVYRRNGDGTYRSAVGAYTSMSRESDGSFTELDGRGRRVVYAPTGSNGVSPMAALSDRHGNTMRFEYDGSGRLTRVLDTLGRPIVYRYDASDRIVAIEDFMGRVVTYKYDVNGDLVAVTSPAVTGTVTDNNYPDGKTTRYTYTSGSPDPLLNHNLASVTAPREVAADGPPRLVLEYDAQDRVSRFTSGGTNGTGVPAGGSATYEYRSLAPPPLPDPNAVVAETDITDMNGNRRTLGFNALGNEVAITIFTNRDIRLFEPDSYGFRNEYNADGELVRRVLPEGNSIAYGFDSANDDRLRQGNMQTVVWVPDSDRGGDQTQLTTQTIFEPIYSQVRSTIDPRGSDPSYTPPNGGTWSPERYTTVNTFDYQEGDNAAALAAKLGISEVEVRNRLAASGIPMNLGDVNGDGVTTDISGNVIRVQRPSARLLAGSNMAGVEGGTSQPIVELHGYNRYGQPLFTRDAEGNVTLFEYHPENDPDGDGADLAVGMSAEPFGYLKAQVRDAGLNVPVTPDPATSVPTTPAPGVTPPTPTPTATATAMSTGGTTIYLPFTARNVPLELFNSISMFSSRLTLIAHNAAPDQRPVPTAPPWRNSGLSPSFANVRSEYLYDRVGNVIQTVDGRGVETRYRVNALNQVVEVSRAADVTGALANDEEPDWTSCLMVGLVECDIGMTAFKYLTRFHYDHNDNVLRIEVENRDGSTEVDLGGWIDTIRAYDILDALLAESGEVTSGEFVTRSYRYDRNGNRVLVKSPVSMLPGTDPESQPSNVTAYIYDERDLVASTTRGGLGAAFRGLPAHADIPALGAIPDGASLSTNLGYYDGNANRTTSTDALDNSGDGRKELTITRYDGFDRPISTIDGLGNQTFNNYDAAGNRVRASRFGPTGGLSPVNEGGATLGQPLTLGAITQPLLSQVELKHDELSRVFEQNEKLFTYSDVPYTRATVLTDGPLGSADDGWITSRTEHDRNGRVTYGVEDEGDTNRTDYDGMNRVIRRVDAESNEVRTSYDDANNMIRLETIEVSRPAEVAADRLPDLRESLTIHMTYDALGRLIRTVDAIGQTTRTRYDSRDNAIEVRDAQHSDDASARIADPLGLFPSAADGGLDASTIDQPGNLTRTTHDGLDRPIAEIIDLNIDGQGGNALETGRPENPDGRITMTTDWDSNNRVVSRADDAGNTTSFGFDDLNRQVLRTMADGTLHRTTYDADSYVTSETDANGSIITYARDGLGRMTSAGIAPGTGIVGTTAQRMEYDGRSRLRLAVDENDPADGFDDSTVVFAYDSRGRLLEEVQNGLTVSGRWSGDGKSRLGLVYPNGRLVETTYDRLDLANTIGDSGAGTPIADVDRIGPSRVLARTMQNGVRMSHLSDDGSSGSGYDRLHRLVRQRHVRADDSLVVGFEYGYDRRNNRTFEHKLHAPATSEHYPYDSAERMVEFERGTLNAERDGLAGAGITQEWALDGVGNWAKRLVTIPGLPASIEDRTHSSLNEVVSIGAQTLAYDDDGNLIDDGTLRFEWDFSERLRTVTRIADGARIATYSYDAIGRRTSKAIRNAAPALNGTTTFLLDGARVIEERGDAGLLLQQYVYGDDIDEPLTVDQNLDGDGVATGGADRRLFFHRNAQFSTYAMTDAAGKIVEGYEYDAYGLPTMFGSGPNGLVDFGGDDVRNVGGISSVGNPYLFTGRRFEPETGLYFYRARYMSPVLGRFISRDPIGTWGDEGNVGNAYAYVGNRPNTARDPFGLDQAFEVCLDKCIERVDNIESSYGEGWATELMQIRYFNTCMNQNCWPLLAQSAQSSLYSYQGPAISNGSLGPYSSGSALAAIPYSPDVPQVEWFKRRKCRRQGGTWVVNEDGDGFCFRQLNGTYKAVGRNAGFVQRLPGCSGGNPSGPDGAYMGIRESGESAKTM